MRLASLRGRSAQVGHTGRCLGGRGRHSRRLEKLGARQRRGKWRPANAMPGGGSSRCRRRKNVSVKKRGDGGGSAFLREGTSSALAMTGPPASASRPDVCRGFSEPFLTTKSAREKGLTGPRIGAGLRLLPSIGRHVLAEPHGRQAAQPSHLSAAQQATPVFRERAGNRQTQTIRAGQRPPHSGGQGGQRREGRRHHTLCLVEQLSGIRPCAAEKNRHRTRLEPAAARER